MKVKILGILQVLGYALAVVITMAVVAKPIKWISGKDTLDPDIEILMIGSLFLVSIPFVNWLIKRFSDSKLINQGWPGFQSGIKSFGSGALMGILIQTSIILLVLLFGGGHLVFESGQVMNYLTYVIPIAFFLMLASLGEEWLFRGYPLSKLSSVFSKNVSNLIISIFFLLAHIGGDGWSILVVINLLVFSLLLGILRFEYGGIPTAWGFHFTWNTTLILFGSTLTSSELNVPMLKLTGVGADWLSGGAMGPEGSILTTALTCGMLFWFYRKSRH